MKKRKKDSVVVSVTKDDLIKNISLKTGRSLKEVRGFYEALEKEFMISLCATLEQKDYELKLFPGFGIRKEFVEEKERKNNLTNRIEKVPAHFLVKPYITRTLKEKVDGKGKL